MKEKISVMVTDDSALMRRMITDMINMEEDMEVIDVAKNGQELLEKLKGKVPDVITLDVEMPKMNGIEALKEIINNKLKTKVIMLSSLTKDGAETTMECLELGAIDFVPKPSGSISLNITQVKELLASKIREAALSRRVSPYKKPERNSERKKEINNSVREWNTLKVSSEPASASRLGRIQNKNKISAVVIGASTGGPKALFDVITKLPENLNVPVLVVQHMPEGFTRSFAERLNKFSNLSVVEAADGMRVVKGIVYIACGGKHMTVEKGKIKLNMEPAIWGVRPAVDKLFLSAVEEYKENILGVILTGMGRDGAEGIKNIKMAGGHTIAEDESTCVIYGMPKAAVQTNMVDEVVPLYEINERIADIVLGKEIV